MPYTLDNILVTTATGDAYLATDWGTSGTGFSLTHVPISKIAYGTDSTTTRVDTSSPLPISIYGWTGTNIGITGTVAGRGTFVVGLSSESSFLKIAGTTFSTIPVGISGNIQGITNGVLVGVTGTVDIRTTNFGVFGISGATAVGITGGRRLNYSSDSVSVYGNVGISGSINLTESTDSIRVYGHDGDLKLSSKIYSSNGTTLGVSGDALKVAVTNHGFTFTVSIGSTVGVSNYGGGLMVKGTGITSDYPIIVQGAAADGSIEVTATEALPVTVENNIDVDLSSIIPLLGATGSIYTALNNIKTNTNPITSINDKLGNGTIQVKIVDNTKPSSVYSGSKISSTAASQLSTLTNRLVSGVHIKSSISNTNTIFVGGSTLVTRSTEGYPLEPGESIFIETGALTTIYVRSSAGNGTINFIAS
jgi:hypothetical protein